MKKLFFLIAIISLACPFVCCKSKKAATATTESTPVTVEKTIEESPVQKYRLIISFISKGEGIDSKRRQEFLTFVETHPKKPVFNTVNWGREGETDYCFMLTELYKRDQIEFITKIRAIAGGTDIVVVSEDAECIHKAR